MQLTREELQEKVKGLIGENLTFTKLAEVFFGGARLRSGVPKELSDEQFEEGMAKLAAEFGVTYPPAGSAPAAASVPPPPPLPTDMIPADILALELGVPVDQIMVTLGERKGHEAGPNQLVSRSAVEAALFGQPIGGSDSGSQLLVDTDEMRDHLRKHGTRRGGATAEDRRTYMWLYAIIEKWVRTWAGPVFRAEGAEELTDAMDKVIGCRYASPLNDGYIITVMGSDYARLVRSPNQRFPMISDELLWEIKRRLAALSTFNHLCARCGMQLHQSLDQKIDVLFSLRLAVPLRARETQKLREELNYPPLKGRLRTLRFRQVHTECKAYGAEVDALVHEMNAQGVDFANPAVIEEFLDRVAQLVGVVFRKLKDPANKGDYGDTSWLTLEQLQERAIAIVEMMSREDD